MENYYNNKINELVSKNTDRKRTIMDIDGIISKYGCNLVLMYDYKSINDKTTINTLDILSNFTCTQEGSKIRITFPCFTSNSRGKDTSQGPHHIALWENTNGQTDLWQDPDWQTRTDGEIVSVLLDLDVDRVYYTDPSQAPIDKTQLLEFQLYTTKPGTSNYVMDRTIYRESDWHINYVP